MTRWPRRIGGAVAMGLAWAAAWAPAAVLIGLMVDPDASMDEMWPAVGAYPGFLCGLIFYAMIAAGRRGLDEMPSSGVAARGAAAGLLVGALPFTLGTSTSTLPVWLLAGIVIGSITLLSALSAAGSAWIFRHRGGGRAPAGAAPQS